MKRTYEVLYIVKPTILNDDIDEIVEALANVAKENGANVLSCGKWDNKELAYSINGYKNGVYCLMYVEGEGNIPAVLYREFRISDDILRGIVTVVDTRYVNTSKIEKPAAVEERKDVVKPEAVIPSNEELEKLSTGEAAANEKKIEIAEETPATEEVAE